MRHLLICLHAGIGFHLSGNRIGFRDRLIAWLEFGEIMRRISRAKRWRVTDSRAAVPVVLAVVMVASCGGNDVSVVTSGSASPRQTRPSTTTTTTTTSPTASSSTTSSTSTTEATADPEVDWADPEAVGRDFFDAWRAGDESRMRLLASEEQLAQRDDLADTLGWMLDFSVPDEPVECRSLDSETVQCDVTVIATGELYYALLRQSGDKWRVDWASVSTVNEGGCC